jgi:hypothetical protein
MYLSWFFTKWSQFQISANIHYCIFSSDGSKKSHGMIDLIGGVAIVLTGLNWMFNKVDLVTSNHNFVILALAGTLLLTWLHPNTILAPWPQSSQFVKLATFDHNFVNLDTAGHILLTWPHAIQILSIWSPVDPFLPTCSHPILICQLDLTCQILSTWSRPITILSPRTHIAGPIFLYLVTSDTNPVYPFTAALFSQLRHNM